MALSRGFALAHFAAVALFWGAGCSDVMEAGKSGAGGGGGAAGESGGASGGGGGDVATLVPATFGSFNHRVTIAFQNVVQVGEDLTIQADGTITDGGSAKLSNDDLGAFAALATSQENIDGLLTVHCGQVADGTDSVTLQVGPGVFLSNGASCSFVRGVVEAAESLASRYLHGGASPGSTDAGVRPASAPGRIDWSRLGFASVELDAPSGPQGFVIFNGTIYAATSSGTYASAPLDPATFEEVKRQATNVDLVRALPGNSEPPTSGAKLTVILSPAAGMGGEPSVTFDMGIAGCADGPITALKTLLISALQSVPTG